MATPDRTGAAPVAVLTRAQRDGLWNEIARSLEHHTPDLRDSPRDFEAVTVLLGEIGWTASGNRDAYRVTVTPALVPVAVNYRAMLVADVDGARPAVRYPKDESERAHRELILGAIEAVDLILDHADPRLLAEPLTGRYRQSEDGGRTD